METDVNYIGGEYKVVEVNYIGTSPKRYYFKADIDLDIKDHIVVDDSNSLSIVKVLDVFENTIENADKVKKAKAWVVDTIDMTAQNKRKDASKKREYIIQQLEEKKAQMEAISVYEMLAKVDSSAAKLLDELKSL